MNRIVISSYEFTDETITENPQKYISNSMLADSLEIDTLEFSVISYGIGVLYIITSDGYTFATSSDQPYVVDEGEFQNLPYGTPVYLYKDNTLRAKFYLQSITRTGLMQFKVSCISAIGLLENARTMGGIYEGETAGSIIDSLMADANFTDYTIDEEIANLSVYGWIPAGSVRQALVQVLFAFGASILKSAQGSMRIYFIGATTPTVLPDSINYIGGTLDNPQTVTDVNLYEHSFVVSTDNIEEVLFDNSLTVAANGLTMIFSEPFHSFRTTGTLTVDESGANYAIVTGIGQLLGKKYTHTRRLLTKNINEGQRNEVTIEDATLISTANSSNCLKRLATYYQNAIPMNISLVDESGIKPGDYVQLTDPFGDTVQGFIQAVDETVSEIDKANSTIIKNYIPSNLGNSYDSYVIVTEDDFEEVYEDTASYIHGRWNVPTELEGKEVLIVLFSGAQGGQGGYAGKTPGRQSGFASAERIGGGSSGGGTSTWEWQILGGSAIQQGADGGAGGAGGASAIRIINYNMESLSANLDIKFGKGGLGGQGGTMTYNGATRSGFFVTTLPLNGAEGLDSEFFGNGTGIISTEDGTAFHGTYINLVTGTAVAQQGLTGGSGAKGGTGGVGLKIANSTDSSYSYTTEGRGSNGSNLGSYTGGSGVNGARGVQADSRTKYPRQWIVNGGGGGGGGAAMGGNGSAGRTPISGRHTYVERYTLADPTIVYEDTYYYYHANWWKDYLSQGVYYQGAVGGDGGDATIIPPQPQFTGGTGGYGGGGGGGAGQSFGYVRELWEDYEADYGMSRGGKGGNGGQGGQGSNGFMIIYYNSQD